MYRTVLIMVVFLASGIASAAVPYEGRVVSGVRVVGLPDGLGGDVASGLALAAPAGILGGSRPVLRPSSLEADTARLALLLARHGHPYASVTSRFEPAADRRVAVVFEVAPGRPVAVGEVALIGAPPERPALADRVRAMLPAGSVFTDATATAAADTARLETARAGYAEPQVAIAVSVVDSFRADITLTVAAGERARVAGVRVTGVAADLEDLAGRSMAIAPGTMFSPDLAPRAQDNLRELQLFRQVRVTARRTGPGELEMLADLAPGAFRSASVSVGSWSDDPVRVRAGWKHRNMFRGGRGLGFRSAASRHVREIGGDAWWPALLGPRSIVNAGVRYRREDEDSYDLESVGVELTALLRLRGRVTVRLGASVEDVSVLAGGADAFDGADGRQFVLAARIGRDRSDHLLHPTRGTRLALEASVSPPGFLSEAPFVSVEATAVAYAPLPGGIVLATRVAAGSAGPLGDAAELLPNRRFFAGGVTTMRGAGRRRLGPRDQDGDPIGGRERLLAAAEVRAPLVGFVAAAAFIDAGQVWTGGDAWSVSDLASAAGGGLIARTPVGPVRLDLARRLDEPRPDEPRTVLHLAIGHPF